MTAIAARALPTAGSVGGDERQAWIALASVDGLGPMTMALLIERLGSAAEVLALAAGGGLDAWSRRNADASGRQPLSPTVRGRIERVAADPEVPLAELRELGLWTVTPYDEDYPGRLRDLDPPPAVIHGLGEPSLLHDARTVAVVGTRRPTAAGRLLASRVCARLVEASVTVVSGLAVGIDGAAHASTLEHRGRTVGVIGGGHRHPGPRAHERLRQSLQVDGGAVISEHHPTIRPTRGTYPRRNRIIAALADATVVVEAPARSGALITARNALELGRPVIVAPGRVGDWSVAGSLALLRETPALPLVGLDEMLEDLGFLGIERVAADETADASRAHALAMLGPTTRAVADRLCRGAAGMDALVAETELPPAAVASALTLLLMRGWAQAVGPAYLPAGPLLR